MSSYARNERQALADLLTEVGPDAPTLCEGWSAADLAAHLVIRERRPDAAAGILIKPLAGYTSHVQDGVRGRPWPELVDTVRSGPPFPLRLNAVDEAVNTVEYFVHLEDVRRAGPGWEPRWLDPGFEQALWSRLKTMARVLFRRSPVGVTLAAPGYGEVAAKAGEPRVTLTGPPGELLLFAFGRQAATRVETAGDPAAVTRLRQASLGL
ncbi:MAG TPA: TIGR03085 family metal-binding protein [Acidimicrobiales bacterium]|nr:TIGR03085 family metal-binding protein [Acidimicrobiales bacterium]